MEITKEQIKLMKEYYDEKYHTYVFKDNELKDKYIKNINIDKYLEKDYIIMYTNSYIDIYDKKQLYFSFHSKYDAQYLQNKFNKKIIFYNKFKNESLEISRGNIYASNLIRFYGNECYPVDSKLYQITVSKDIHFELKENFNLPDNIIIQINLIYEIDNCDYKEVYGQLINGKFFHLKLDTKKLNELEELPKDLYEREFIFAT